MPWLQTNQFCCWSSRPGMSTKGNCRSAMICSRLCKNTASSAKWSSYRILSWTAELHKQECKTPSGLSNSVAGPLPIPPAADSKCCASKRNSHATSLGMFSRRQPGSSKLKCRTKILPKGGPKSQNRSCF